MQIQKAFAVILLTITLGCSPKTEPTIVSVTTTDLENAIENENIQLLDVRTPKEFNNGHIQGATNLNIKDINSFEAGTVKLDKEKSIYVYCKAGVRSKKASEKLKELGFKLIFDYSEGYNGWKAAR